MTDSSSLANALSEPLRQPFWWAALASVGLHGVLGVSAPTISNIIYGGGGNSSKNLPGSVGFVELTAAEAGRLPQTIPPRPSNTPFSLVAPVPLPTSPKFAPALPPAPPAINLPALPPGMPPPGFFSPLPPSPLPPLTAPTAPQPPKTPAPTAKTPSLTTPTLIPPVPPSGLIFPPLPGNFDRNIPPPPPGVTAAPQFPGNQDEGEALEKLRNAQGRLPLFPDGAPVFSPGFPISRNPGPDGAPKLTQKDPNKHNVIAETPEERTRLEQFGQGQQQLEEQGNPGSDLPRDRDEKQRAQFVAKYGPLLENFQKAYPDLAPAKEYQVNIPYPVAACSQKLEGTAVFGVVVTDQGRIKADPQTILSTGSPILDTVALTAITNATFQPASSYRLYPVTVAFKYDEKVCSGIPVTPSTGPTKPRPTGQQPPVPAPTEPNPTGQSPSPAPAEVKPQFEKPPAASNKPKPGAQPSPPAPQPATKPSPSPQPKPAAQQSPSPQPKPAAEQLPQPEAAPSPAEESPQPEAAPSPAEVSPSPAPSPAEVSPPSSPAPSPAEVSPSPEAAPSPAEVSPSPAPSPATEN